MNLKNKMLDGIMGLCVGDALGVPVEFLKRDELRKSPVTEMIGYGTYDLSPGSWSDDSSMTFALLDSLKAGLNYKDIMDKFANWFENGDYTPHGKCFDIGIGTRKSIFRYWDGKDPLQCGGYGELDNGNGSLMRILPVVFFLYFGHNKSIISSDGMQIIHNISSLTHNHPRSLIACGIYISIAFEIMIDQYSLENSIQKGINNAKEFYEKDSRFSFELASYKRIFEDDFKNLEEDKIKSTGYVVDTLEASIWCLLNTDSYEDAVLKGVNLGEDTDTTGAVIGGLAGLYYGYENIPEEWKKMIVKREWIEKLCDLKF